MNKLVGSVIGVAFLFALSGNVNATPIPGGSLFVDKTGEVKVTFLGENAYFSNDLYLYLWDENSGSFQRDNDLGLIFNNKTAHVNETVSLGTFTAGQELIFGIYVNNTQNTFFTGDASRNADNLVHAIVDDSYAVHCEQHPYCQHRTRSQHRNHYEHITFVGFEDDLYGGDSDYNDLMLSFTNTTTCATTNVPEPSLISLLGLGLMAFVFKRKHS